MCVDNIELVSDVHHQVQYMHRYRGKVVLYTFISNRLSFVDRTDYTLCAFEIYE